MTSAQQRLLSAALGAAERGWHVFPLRPDDKRPAVNDWEKRATTDPARVQAWWSQGHYNVGIACGPSDLLILDLDMPKSTHAGQRPVDGRTALARLATTTGHPYPGRTYAVTTGTGGTHLYFAQPGTEALRNTAGRLGPLIDTRGHGGYVVAAGSTVRSRPYVTADDRPITDLPPWLFDALHPLPRTPGPDLDQLIAGIRHRSTYATAALLAEVDRVHLARPGTRNNALNTAAYSLGRLVGTGLLTTDDTTAALHAAATAAGLAEPEITRTIRSGLRAGIHH